MLIPVYASYQPTELEYKEALKFLIYQVQSIGGAANFCFVMRFTPNLLQARGSNIKLVFPGLQSGNISINNVYFGKSASSGGAPGFDPSPAAVPVQVNGSNSFTIPPEGVTSDNFIFDVTPNVAYSIAVDIAPPNYLYSPYYNASPSTASYIPGYTSNSILFWRKPATAGEAANNSKTGYGDPVLNMGVIVGNILVAP